MSDEATVVKDILRYMEASCRRSGMTTEEWLTFFRQHGNPKYVYLVEKYMEAVVEDACLRTERASK